jgi:hypothetical protein
MQLWNDYEGKTIDGQWPLGRLLRTEGRSALFTTTRPSGGAAVLRLTEALNDQAVLQARYRAIQAAGDQYLVAVETYGDAELDGAPLSYAVLEPTEESLAEILSQRSLSVEEMREVAQVIAGGLLGLHAHGLVHGLVEPESVLAAGERIKLRADCARPGALPEDALLEGAVTPQTDAYGLAGVVYQGLTRNRLQDAADALALPEPFATIVRNTARGAWGVVEIDAELKRTLPRVSVPVAAAAAPAGTHDTVTVTQGPGVVVGVDAAAEGVRGPVARDAAGMVQPMLPLIGAAGAGAGLGAVTNWQQPEPVVAGRRKGILIGVAAVVVVLLLFVLFHHSAGPAAGGKTVATGAATGAATGPVMAPDAAPASVPAAAHAGSASATGTVAHAADPVREPVRTLPAGSTIWRVVAFTYNQRDEAAHKAELVNARFPGMHAQVWSRTGKRPFLVTLGGEMTQGQAFAERAKARQAGVARDVYAQNYKE